MAIWYSVDTPEAQARFVSAWGGIDAPTDELGAFLLDIAREQVLAYAPAPAEVTPEVNVRFTLVDGVPTEAELLFSADLEPGYNGTVTLPLTSRGLRLEAVYDNGTVIESRLTTAPEVIPPAYVYAQLQQARNLWNAGQANTDGSMGGDGYSYTPRPLDKTIRSLLRPTTGVANVF